MKRIFGILIAFVFILFLIPMSVNADDFIPPGPFYILSEDETKVFHVSPPFREDTVKTGLYYNTDPLIPIYLVEIPFGGIAHGHFWEQDFIFSRDMQYFVWIPATNAANWSDAARTAALVFFANGIVQKTYMVSDLIHDIDAVSWSTTMAMWICTANHRRGRDIVFDAETNRLTIRTVDFRTYVFDITSGEIIEGTLPSRSPSRISWLQITVLSAVGIIVLVGGIAFFHKKRKHAN